MPNTEHTEPNTKGQLQRYAYRLSLFEVKHRLNTVGRSVGNRTFLYMAGLVKFGTA